MPAPPPHPAPPPPQPSVAGSGESPPQAATRLARVVTEAFSPAHLVIALALAVGATSTSPPLAGLAWGALAALMAGVLPYAFLLHGVRHGRYTDRHVPLRQQRTVPLAVAGASVIAGVALLALLGAPQVLTALAVAMLVGLALTVAITQAWKISVHTAVAAGSATILTLVYGGPLATTALLVAATGWSRVVLRAHTTAQVTAGALLGAGVAGGVFTALR